jgi:CheY-like chemotaxis protein
MDTTNKPILFFLIDDDEDDRELFQLALEKVDAEIICKTAINGRDALKILEGNIAPDFIFLDLNMPEMDGRECLKELKLSAKTKDIPVIIFSTSSEPKDIHDTKVLGAVGFITKPSKVSELTNSLNYFLINQLQKT